MSSPSTRHLRVLESGPRLLSPAEQQQAIAFPALREVRTVFCMIATDDISVRRCLATQGTKECFGCASPSRVCESCHSATLAFPEVTMCDQCLTQARMHEQRLVYDGNPNITVQCHLAGGSYISAKTCHKTQGDACGTCPAPTRYCKKCKKHQSYYAEYGLCLSCTINTFGKKWLAKEERVGRIEQILEAGVVAPIEREIRIPEPEREPAKPLRIMRPQPIEYPCTSCGEAPMFFTKLKLCVDCFTTRWTNRKRVRGRFFETAETQAAFLKLMPRLVSTLVRGRWFSVARFARNLKVNQLEARALLEKLEEAGIVSAPAGARRASLLRRAEEIAALLAQLPELEVVSRVKIGKLPVITPNRVIILDGQEFRNATQWARMRKISPDKLIQKLKLIGARTVIGLNDRGYALVRCYSATDVSRAIGSDLVRKQDGSFRAMPRDTYFMEDTYWGRAGAWASYFGVSSVVLGKALQSAARVKFPTEKGSEFWFYEQKVAERAAMALIRERNKRRAKNQPAPALLEASKKSNQDQPEKPVTQEPMIRGRNARLLKIAQQALREMPRAESTQPKTVPTVVVGKRHGAPREVATIIETFPWKNQRERDIFVLYLGIGCEPMILKRLAERFKITIGRIWKIQFRVRQRMTKMPGWQHIEPYAAKTARRGGRKKQTPREVLPFVALGPREASNSSHPLIDGVAAFYKLDVAAVLGPRGRQRISRARHVAMHFLREYAYLSYPKIAVLFGRHHTTVMHACRFIKGRQEHNGSFRHQLERIESRLRASGAIK